MQWGFGPESSADAAMPFEVTTNFTQDMLLAQLLAARRALEPWRKRSTTDWVKRLDPRKSMMVQVGANDHSVDYNNVDPGPLCAQGGWQSLLIEPAPSRFAVLRRRYENGYPNVKLLNAAICGSSCTAEALSLIHI